MIEKIIQYLHAFPKELIVMILSALPISELRGAIPAGLSMGIPVYKVFLISVIGNILPVPIILKFLDPVTEYLRRFPAWKKFFDWLFERTKKKANVIEKYEALGLCFFVAIPLPMTGAWSGCIAASLFKIRFTYALISIALGVLLAGVIVTALCLMAGAIL